MAKIFILLSAIAFMINFAAFMLALICRFNIKRMMMIQGKNPDQDAPDFADMYQVNKNTAKQYQVAIRFWIVSLIILIVSIVAAFIYK